MNGTLNWGNVYGPSGGQAVSQGASTSIMDGVSERVPLTLPVIIAIGLLAWWALEQWD